MAALLPGGNVCRPGGMCNLHSALPKFLLDFAPSATSQGMEL